MNPWEPSGTPLDLDALRQRLAGQRGRVFWRSVEELADSPEFHEYLHREFPRQAGPFAEIVDRRKFLQLMAASFALAGLSGCDQAEPQEPIVPYVYAPERLVPGVPLYFATAMPHADGALGLLVQSHEGRPTKVEGNPLHPASLGATDNFAQASVLTLYDPDRAQTVRHLGEINTWDGFTTALAAQRAVLGRRAGRGLHLLTETVTSPTLGRQLEALLSQLPEARWHRYEPIAAPGNDLATQALFGQPLQPVYDFTRAEVVVALDANFLARGPTSVRYAHDFMQRRRAHAAGEAMNRLYVVESTSSSTGAAADHRLPLPASDVADFTRRLAAMLGVSGVERVPRPSPSGAFDPSANDLHQRWLMAIVEDLQARPGASLVVPGAQQPPVVHALAQALNARLGNVGQTVRYLPPLETGPLAARATLEDLAAALRRAEVDLLVILGGNPAYAAPADLDFAALMRRAPLAVHMSLYHNETSRLCRWHLPESHYLESWSDARAFDGVASVIQPLIAPLYESRTAHELLSLLADDAPQSAYDLVRATWRPFHAGQTSDAAPTFEAFWESALHAGVIPNSAAEPVAATLAEPLPWNTLPDSAAPPATDALELNFEPDPSVWDGRYANNAWLQELPKPLTKLTWDNAALISPELARQRRLKSGDLVRLTHSGRSVNAPVWVLPGQPARSITLPLGYGRSFAGRVGDGVGFDAYRLRTTLQPWSAWGVQVEPLGETYPLATTQQHYSLEGRDIVRWATLDHYRADPQFAQHEADRHPPPSLYPEWEYNGYAWGMAIDMTSCVGCNACVVACQAENNIPIVGKENVLLGREMHWLRIDRYYATATENSAAPPENPLENPEVFFQPMLCQHCEKAPCEVVCPVAATTHSPEGLNEMTYNRCVGTRYCSNNCPYKVRRFNFFDYHEDELPVVQLQYNPVVTVRSRGVMEKCTYCVQRINSARITAKIADVKAADNVRIPPNTPQTACQQACPTQAIVFGDLNNPLSDVTQRKQSPLNYGVLAELGTQPRTSYLARLRNPHPLLSDEVSIRPVSPGTHG